MMKLGVGGGCHWCTEGVFRSVVGVKEVKQGWISSEKPYQNWSEGIEVHFDPQLLHLPLLLAIHLHSHSCTANHSFREKYRSAIYYFNIDQKEVIHSALLEIQKDFDQPIITKVIPFKYFKLNEEQFLDYYYKNPELPFCTNHILPKLNALSKRFQEAIQDQDSWNTRGKEA
jgi:peptide-methionine (S)-S-oxide reductase